MDGGGIEPHFGPPPGPVAAAYKVAIHRLLSVATMCGNVRRGAPYGGSSSRCLLNMFDVRCRPRWRRISLLDPAQTIVDAM